MRAVVGLVAVAMLLPACTPAEQACTLIAALRGVSVVVGKDIAGEVTALKLRVCQEDLCTEKEVSLTPGSTTVDQGCDGSGPDSACSASASPDGSKVGFLEVPDLVEGKARIRAELTRSGRVVALPPLEKAARMSYPNGPNCGGGAAQLTLTIDSAGLH